MKKISIIVPTLNEASSIQSCLACLQSFRERGHEVLVIDGNSMDATISMTAKMADFVHSAPRGRAVQLNFGAQKASGDLLLFVHADTRLHQNAGCFLGSKIQLCLRLELI